MKNGGSNVQSVTTSDVAWYAYCGYWVRVIYIVVGTYRVCVRIGIGLYT